MVKGVWSIMTYTLPVTCKQLYWSLGIGLNLLLIPLVLYGVVFYSKVAFAIWVAEAIVFAILGFVIFLFTIGDHVKCKCDK